ncbi:MAG: CoA-binding protein [Chloroflexi bacterium B3_Chlor]|nr:MAG: CoA-binding protein [Chloroflexi bacterium B3_Chlor]
MDQPTDDEILSILTTAKTVAVVGLSSKPERPSYRVAKFLKDVGYRIYPVNPNIEEALGEKAYASLEEVPAGIDIVDVFRASDKVLPVVEAAIRVGARVVWMQEGVVNKEAARKAREAGLKVVMDRCMMREYERLVM